MGLTDIGNHHRKLQKIIFLEYKSVFSEKNTHRILFTYLKSNI